MKPDKFVIYFTVSSGTGYGIIMSLLCVFIFFDLNIPFNLKVLISTISFLMITSGLVASTVHLGHPERAWRALSQWRSSWLSREGLAAIIGFIPIILFYYFWIFMSNPKLSFYFLIISSLFSLITIYCTAKIYSSLKSIPAWNNPLVPIIYIINSLVLGSLITFTILFYYKIKIDFLSNFIIALTFSALFIKTLYWFLIKQTSKSNISTATGLGTKHTTNFFEGPHTGKNFLTSEMINKIKKSKSSLLRIIFCIFTYITPAYFLIQLPYLILSDYVISINLIVITILAIIGMLIERYLFFIEAKHTVSLYYGNKTI